MCSSGPLSRERAFDAGPDGYLESAAMTPGPERPTRRIRRLSGARLTAQLLIAGILLLTACAKSETHADSHGQRVFIPLLSSPPTIPNQMPVPKRSEVVIEGILQNGPDNQILVLRNHGTGAQDLGGWILDLVGTGPIYEFPGGIITPFGGKIWVTTSRDSRLSVFTLGYGPEGSGRRYIQGNEIILRDSEGREVHRYAVREIGELPLPGQP